MQNLYKLVKIGLCKLTRICKKFMQILHKIGFSNFYKNANNLCKICNIAESLNRNENMQISLRSIYIRVFTRLRLAEKLLALRDGARWMHIWS